MTSEAITLVETILAADEIDVRQQREDARSRLFSFIVANETRRQHERGQP